MFRTSNFRKGYKGIFLNKIKAIRHLVILCIICKKIYENGSQLSIFMTQWSMSVFMLRKVNEFIFILKTCTKQYNRNCIYSCTFRTKKNVRSYRIFMAVIFSQPCIDSSYTL